VVIESGKLRRQNASLMGATVVGTSFVIPLKKGGR
jgi:hypothetical protein